MIASGPTKSLLQRDVAIQVPNVMQEVLIFADQSMSFGGGVIPDVGVVGLIQLQIEDVLGVMPARVEETSKVSGKLVIHQKFHEAWRTTWSVCLAAYSIAARISSRSKKG